ncbi:unnamed protein product [Oncorhynchus mykiss]|uniref:Uncharacterized protein n=1 Tax=Oncorhynchus mykiss TaxID=8022 RepID=A0A060X1B1_ONCMY|nr:unnamed protein product [Oncorhynchus mykiss]
MILNWCQTNHNCLSHCCGRAAMNKNFDDEDSVDGGRSCSSASSSKAPPSGRRTVAAASVRRPSSATGSGKISAKDAAAGAVDEEDFIKAFEEVPTIQIHSNREMEENLSKVREVLSDDKNDWEHRVIAVRTTTTNDQCLHDHLSTLYCIFWLC